MKGLIPTLREAFNGSKSPNPSSKLLKNGYGDNEEKTVIPFSDLINYHDKTPQIQLGVLAYSELITGTEIQINSDDDGAKKLIEKWNQETNFYDKFESMVNTLLICGNSILEKLDERKTVDVVEVDMRTIVGKKRDEYGNTQYYEVQTNQGTVDRLGEGKLKKFIEFNLSNYSRQPWGKSLFQSLAMTRSVGNRVTRPLIEILWGIEDAMGTVIVNHAYPDVEYIYEGMSDEDLEKEAEKLRKRKPGDKTIANRKREISITETKGESKYEGYINHIEKVIQLGIKFPHDIMTGDFTSRASSDTTEDLTLKLARGFQRYLANKIKQELYDEILKQNGFDPNKANLTVAFTTQNIIKLKPEQVADRVSRQFWTKREGREWDKDNLGVDLFDDDLIQQNEDLNIEMRKQALITTKANRFKSDYTKDDEPQKEPQKESKKRMCQACKESQHTYCTKRGCQCR